jgi:hypothetical protein
MRLVELPQTGHCELIAPRLMEGQLVLDLTTEPAIE